MYFALKIIKATNYNKIHASCYIIRVILFLIMAMTLVAMPLASLMRKYFDTMILHSIFLYFKLTIQNIYWKKIYYDFTTFESENIKNYKNICKYLPKIKMS